MESLRDWFSSPFKCILSLVSLLTLFILVVILIPTNPRIQASSSLPSKITKFTDPDVEVTCWVIKSINGNAIECLANKTFQR